MFEGGPIVATNAVSGEIGGGISIDLERRCPPAAQTGTPLPNLTFAGGLRAGAYALAVAGIEFIAWAEPVGQFVLFVDFLSGGKLLEPLDLDAYQAWAEGR